ALLPLQNIDPRFRSGALPIEPLDAELAELARHPLRLSRELLDRRAQNRVDVIERVRLDPLRLVEVIVLRGAELPVLLVERVDERQEVVRLETLQHVLRENPHLRPRTRRLESLGRGVEEQRVCPRA